MNQQLFINGQAKFPVSTEALDFIQQQILLTARLASIAGTNVIITPATTTADGLVVINGELLPLLAGTAKQYIQIIETKQSIVAGTQTFTDVRIIRFAQYANSGTPVSQFTTLDTIVRLMQRISTVENSYMTETAIRALVSAVQTNLNTTNTNLATTNTNLGTTNGNLSALAARVQTIENNYKTSAQITDLLNANAQHHLPKGSIIDWYGTCRAASVPYGFVPCGMFGKDLTTDALRISEKAAWEALYPNKISITRTGSNGAYLLISTCNGQTVPNLSNRFIVQAGNDYSLGATGGASSVILTENQMPSHKHSFYSYNDDYNGSGGGENGDTGNNKPWLYGLSHDSVTSSNFTSHKKTHDNLIKETGGGASHENRPPYFALYKLIKVI